MTVCECPKGHLRWPFGYRLELGGEIADAAPIALMTSRLRPTALLPAVPSSEILSCARKGRLSLSPLPSAFLERILREC